MTKYYIDKRPANEYRWDKVLFLPANPFLAEDSSSKEVIRARLKADANRNIELPRGKLKW
jgi:hypothetical protein